MMNIFNLSFGKDSMATLLLALEKGIQIDHVMYVDIRFSPEISGEHPLMAEWIPTAEKRLKEKFGIVVEHVYSGVSFVEQFYKVKQKGNHVGVIYGFPYVVGAWCNSMLKVAAIQKYLKQFDTFTQFIGIAYDEPVRWERMLKKETDMRKFRSLLVENRLTEQDAFRICDRYGLLSPMYKTEDGIFRGGCWFCPKQCYSGIYNLWKNYPELYTKLLQIEPDSHNTFKPGITLQELAERFENGYIPKRRKKRVTNEQLRLEV